MRNVPDAFVSKKKPEFRNSFVSRFVLPFLAVAGGGLLTVALAWLLYLGIYLGLERLFYAADPQRFPADALRTACALAFSGLYLLLPRAKWPPLLRAALLVGPLTVLFITVILDLYNRLYFAIPIVLVITVLCVFFLIARKRPWFFYWALLFSLLVSLAYGWPE